MPKIWMVIQFFGGPADGLTMLTTTPLLRTCTKHGHEYHRDYKKDKNKVRAYSLVDKPQKPS